MQILLCKRAEALIKALIKYSLCEHIFPTASWFDLAPSLTRLFWHINSFIVALLIGLLSLYVFILMVCLSLWFRSVWAATILSFYCLLKLKFPLFSTVQLLFVFCLNSHSNIYLCVLLRLFLSAVFLDVHFCLDLSVFCQLISLV